MIFTGFFYQKRLVHGELHIRDDKFYPGKAFETFFVWWDYIKKNYPDEHIYIFVDLNSIGFDEAIKYINEPYEKIPEGCDHVNFAFRIHVKTVSKYAGDYFGPMQRNIVGAITIATKNNVDLLWIDNDCFLNTNILDYHTNKFLVYSPEVSHDQMTMSSYLFYISINRLNFLNKELNIVEFLNGILDNPSIEIRVHSIHEAGLYKLFWIGGGVTGLPIKMSHMSCYDNFIKFLTLNKLETPKYNELLSLLKDIDLEGVQTTFNDSYYE